MDEHFEGDTSPQTIIGPEYGPVMDDDRSAREHDRVEHVHPGRSGGGAPPLDPRDQTPPRGRAPKQRSGGGRGRWVLAAIAVVILAFGAGIGGAAVDHHWIDTDNGSSSSDTLSSSLPAQPSNSKPATSAVAATSTGTQTPGQIYAAASPSVVNITSKGTTTDESAFGFPQTEQSVATGSGIVIDTDGHIVTNAHVIAGASDITVSFSGGTPIKATVVGQDASDDLAVLKVDTSAVKGLTPLAFADSSSVKVGDAVVAIGNPFDLDRTLTSGIVSALQRQIQGLNSFTINNVIQTDAAINPGNSGGPLLNTQGQVIGINSQIATASSDSGTSVDGSVGIGFAIPSNTVKRIAQELIDKGSVAHAFLGVEGSDVTPSVAKLFRLPSSSGVLIANVTKDSPAGKAGITGGSQQVTMAGTQYALGGSEITKFDGKNVTGMVQLQELVDAKNPGDSVDVTYYDGSGKQHTTTVKLGTRPASADSTSSTQSQGSQGLGQGSQGLGQGDNGLQQQLQQQLQGQLGQ